MGERASVLDVCCGPRGFWFEPKDARAVFMDCRQYEFEPSPSVGGKTVVIAPDVLGDFRAIPFADDTFSLVVFDPPHMLASRGTTGDLAKRYGILTDHWEVQFRQGFRECFRVLKPGGTLIFKWGAVDIPLNDVLRLTPAKPLFGHRSGAKSKTHWVAFQKPEDGDDQFTRTATEQETA